MAKTEEKEKEIKKESRLQLKKKTWCKIVSPPFFGSKEMGETYLPHPEQAVGRSVKINVRELTGNPKDQNAYLVFRLEKAEGTSLHTAAIGYEMLLLALKRLSRPGTDRLDDSFLYKSKTGTIVRIKVVIVTLRKIDRSVQAQLRRVLHATFQEELNKNSFSLFLKGIIETTMRAALKKKLDKVYPVQEIAIRYIRLVKAGKEGKEAAGVEAEELPGEAELSSGEALEQEGAAASAESVLEQGVELARGEKGQTGSLTEPAAEAATA